MKKAIKPILIVLLAIVVLIGGYSAYQSIPVSASKQETLTVDSPELTIGIMSDNQLGQDEKFKGMLTDALEMFKEKDVNAIMNVGDYTDVGTKEFYDEYAKILNSVFPDQAKPIRMSIMGNHDYWLGMLTDVWEIPFKGKMQRRFMKATGETSPWTHKVINGYHFIGASPTNGGMGQEAYAKKIGWIKEQIEIAIKDNPNNPVFVMTHNNPQGTVYMSDSDGCENLNELFKNYPQVISLSGHSHASLMDEESIFQQDYTAVNTQCLSYVCFAENEIQLYQDEQSFIQDSPIAMIMTIKDNKVSFQRYSVGDKKEIKEPWIVDFPVSKENFNYTTANRELTAVSPAWGADFAGSAKTGKSNDGKDVDIISFTAASHPDYVKYYQLAFTDSSGKPVTFTKDEKKLSSLNCVSDYILPEEKRAKTVDIKITEDWLIKQLPAGKYTVSVTATSSFSKPSATQTFDIELKY